MSYKSVLKSNRVFLDPGNTTAITELSDSYIVGSGTPIPVTSTSNFKQAGYLTIGGESVFYYTGKTTTTFTGVTRISGATSFTSGTQVSQAYTVPNQISTEDSGLAGWYIDGASNQASLRVSDSPVIQPGVIRYTADGGFQGCIATDPSIEWVEFNAITGPQGEPGIVNGVIEFEYKTPTGYPTSNSAGVVATESLNTSVTDNTAPPIYLKKIVSGSTPINGHNVDTTRITDNSDSIVLNPVAQPYTWDVTSSTSDMRTPITVSPDTIKHYGQTEKYIVRAGSTIAAGQAVRFITEDGHLVIEPFTYVTPAVLDPYNNFAGPLSIAFAGIALETKTGDGSITANVCSSGITLVKIGASGSVYGAPYESLTRAGLACILNTNGFGIAINAPSSNKWFEIGHFIDSASNAVDGTYVLVKLYPRFMSS